MVSFLLAIVLLLLGYLLYSKVIERIVEVDPNCPTPAVAHPDGVAYVPMKPWRISLIQFLKTDLGENNTSPRLGCAGLCCDIRYGSRR